MFRTTEVFTQSYHVYKNRWRKPKNRCVVPNVAWSPSPPPHNSKRYSARTNHEPTNAAQDFLRRICAKSKLGEDHRFLRSRKLACSRTMTTSPDSSSYRKEEALQHKPAQKTRLTLQTLQTLQTLSFFRSIPNYSHKIKIRLIWNKDKYKHFLTNFKQTTTMAGKCWDWLINVCSWPSQRRRLWSTWIIHWSNPTMTECRCVSADIIIALRLRDY